MPPLRFLLALGLLSHPGLPLFTPKTPPGPVYRRLSTTRYSLPPVPRTPPILAIVESGSLDSTGTIIARDLNLGDVVQASLAAAPSQGYTLQLIGSADTLAYVLSNGSQTLLQARVLLPVALDRVEFLRDSVGGALGAQTALTLAQVPILTLQRDSLWRALHAARPRTRKKEISDAWLQDSLSANQQFNEVSQSLALTPEVLHADSLSSLQTLDTLVLRSHEAAAATTRARRWLLHGLADTMQLYMTGSRGIAQSRIAYVQDGHIRVVDFDGANDHAVTFSGGAMSPAWHPSGDKIVYTDMEDAGTQIAEIDLRYNTTKLFHATARGMNITPVYVSGGQEIIYANNVTGTNADLVRISATDSTLPPIRVDAGARYDNSSPTPSPDGSRIAFISPRPKTPQIYSVRLDGTDERLETPYSSGIRSYRTGPDWSPDGRSIAYEQQNGDFQIWTIDIATRNMRALSSVAENEDPTWAPDSRHLALTSTRSGVRTIWILDTRTRHWRQLTTGPGGRLASWSHLLPTSW